MKTIKRLTEDEVRKIVADYFKVKEDKVEFGGIEWAYEDWLCEVEVE